MGLPERTVRQVGLDRMLVCRRGTATGKRPLLDPGRRPYAAVTVRNCLDARIVKIPESRVGSFEAHWFACHSPHAQNRESVVLRDRTLAGNHGSRQECGEVGQLPAQLWVRAIALDPVHG